MNIPQKYRWQTAYVSATFETEQSKWTRSIAEARKAIENRLIKPIQIHSPEHLAIQAVWKRLAPLES
jgi:hypothetical protein